MSFFAFALICETKILSAFEDPVLQCDFQISLILFHFIFMTRMLEP